MAATLSLTTSSEPVTVNARAIELYGTGDRNIVAGALHCFNQHSGQPSEFLPTSQPPECSL